MIGLLLAIMTINSGLWLVILINFSDYRIIAFLFSFECFTLFVDSLQTLGKYTTHLADLYSNHSLEARSVIMYYIEFISELVIQVSMVVYFGLIFVYHGLTYNIVDAIILMHIRHYFSSVCKKISQYLDFRKALLYMRTQYADAGEQDILLFNDDCAICREPLESAKKLPCGHLFHLLCLRSWLAHHSSCPTCRRPLSPSFQTHSPHRLNIQLDQFIMNPPDMHHINPQHRQDNAVPNEDPLMPPGQLPQPAVFPLAPRELQVHLPPVVEGLHDFDDDDEVVDVGDEMGFAILNESGGNTPQYQPEYDPNMTDFYWGVASSSSSSFTSGEVSFDLNPSSARTRPRDRVFS